MLGCARSLERTGLGEEISLIHGKQQGEFRDLVDSLPFSSGILHTIQSLGFEFCKKSIREIPADIWEFLRKIRELAPLQRYTPNLDWAMTENGETNANVAVGIRVRSMVRKLGAMKLRLT